MIRGATAEIEFLLVLEIVMECHPRLHEKEVFFRLCFQKIKKVCNFFSKMN